MTLERKITMNALLTIRAVAERLLIAYPTAYRWVAKGAIPSQRIGDILVVTESDFEKFATDYRAGKYERWPK